MGALSAALAGLLEPIGVTLDSDDLGVVHQAVDQRDEPGGIGKDSRRSRAGVMPCCSAEPNVTIVAR